MVFYGLQTSHARYPAFVASFLELKVTLFPALILLTYLQDGSWNIFEFEFPIYVCAACVCWVVVVVVFCVFCGDCVLDTVFVWVFLSSFVHPETATTPKIKNKASITDIFFKLSPHNILY